MRNRRVGIQCSEDVGQGRSVGKIECAVAGAAEFLEMSNGAEGDADIARERSRVGAGGAYSGEAKRVGTVGGEGDFEMLDFDAATLGRFYVLAAARETIEGNSGAFNSGVHRRDLVDHAGESRSDLGNCFGRNGGNLG